MPAPATPTAFAVDSLARPWTQSLGGGVSNYTAAKLTWAHSGDWARLQMLIGSVWTDLVQGASAVGYNVTSLTSTSAEIRALIGTASFRVSSANSSGASAWTAQVDVVAATGAVTLADLVAPVITLTTNSTSQVKITWPDGQDHESYFELELRNAATGAVRTYGLGTFVREFVRVLGVDGVLPLTSYTARVRAISTGLTTSLEGPWSNELFFTTLAPDIVLITLPATIDWWRNAPSSSYTIRTNTPPTSTSTGALPAGITRAGVVLSGIPTDIVGLYNTTVTVNNATSSDAELLSINVREPALTLQFAKPVGNFSDGITASAAGVGIGALGVAFTARLRAVALGPVSTTLSSITLVGAPSWLGVGTSTITGTPTMPGAWHVEVTASNGTQSCVDVLHITVGDVSITSEDTHTVYDQQPISFPITTAPSTAVVTASGLPAWLTLAGATLTGTAPAPGDTHLTLTATLGTSTASQAFTLHVLPVLTGPPLVNGMAEITGWVGDPLIEAIYYHGTCSIEHWYLSNQPPGVEVGALTCPGPNAENKAVAIVGAPTTYGIFEAVVTAQCCCDGSPKLYRFPVRFNISGGLFLHWFHGDPFRRELQVLLRTGEVHSLYETTSEVLWLKRGDRAKIHILFRDGPFGDSRIARTITTEGFDELRLVIRPLDDFDAEPYFDLGGALVTETVGGKTLAFFEFDVKADAISRAFDETNKSRGANPAAAGLQASGELTWKRSGHPDTSKRFAVRISQDIER